ncbi:hypothetical protein GF406_07875 [candidate division KSB1 bacterium]|jgi:hypothetical protein|nr:hypothetical protein [candidate division KSB1 bacterium]
MKTIFFCFFSILLVYSSVLTAQEQTTKETQSDQTTKPEPRVEEGAIKLFLDKIQVSGRLEKPQAVFIIPGQNPEIDDIRIERSFFREIFRPVEKRGRFISSPTEEPSNRNDYIPW